MISFESDYCTGAHPALLEALMATNLEPQPGYGADRFCIQAAERIKAACNAPDAEVFFLAGGTQTNAVVLSALMKSYEGVVAAQSGHVSVHEAGALEATGHKVLPVEATNGKIAPETLENYLRAFYADGNHEHMVFPGAVFISHPSEIGTLYSLSELEALSRICHYYRIPLYLDGARLGYGLAAPQTDVTLEDVARLTDVFYIGGTKLGALCGEAVVFPCGNMPPHFLTYVKQRGALLAKGRLLGVQFDALFTDELYLNIACNAVQQAFRVKEALKNAGFAMFCDSPTNQQFAIMDNNQIETLAKEVRFGLWEPYDEERSVVRFVTSWSTAAQDVDGLMEALGRVGVGC